jgi:hypothetical protein
MVSKHRDDDVVQFPSLFSERISFARVGESAPRGYSFSRRKAELQVAIVSRYLEELWGRNELAKMSVYRSQGG